MDKLIDAYYKKILILLAIAGGSWVYAIKFFEKGFFLLAWFLAFLFLFVSLVIVVNYIRMNKVIKRMESENSI